MLFAGAAGFFAATALVYGLTSHEEAGSVMLTLAVASLALIAVYLRTQARKTGLRPEDRPDADPGDAAVEIGYFPSSSIWPLVMAGAAAVIANAFVFGVWLAILGGLLFVTAVVGYATEAQGKA
jgi:cytochrome c oxidase subunit IV